MNNRQDTDSRLELVTRYVDNDLNEDERNRFEELLKNDPLLQEEVRMSLSVKSAMRRVKYHNAPERLLANIRAEIGKGERVPLRFFGRAWKSPWFRLSLGFGTAVLILMLWSLRDVPLRSAEAEEITNKLCDGHWLCCKYRINHKVTSDRVALAAYLMEGLSKDFEDPKIALPDLSGRGLQLIEGHICPVVGKFPAAHVYYESDSISLSYYLMPGGVKGETLGTKIDNSLDAYSLAEEYWKGRNDDKALKGILWYCPQGCLCAAIANMPESEIVDLVEASFPIRKLKE